VRKVGTPLTRRELLKQAGLAGAAAAIVPTTAIAPVHPAPAAVLGQAPGAPAITREPLEALTSAEADVLEAFCARLIPTDESGPGAAEARAAHYIDRALAGFLAPNRQAYAAGLAAIDRHAITSHGAAFSRLGPADQDAVLKDVEAGKADGLPSGFFTLVRTHTIQGTFCDPFYGGNANFAGWDLIGYPGVRTIVTPDEQRIGVTLTPNHKSAYDYVMFTKATARLVSPKRDKREGGAGEHDHDGRGLGVRDSRRQDSGGSRGNGDPA
jgi:gluconate 2-dehydrogenase gamma chain